MRKLSIILVSIVLLSFGCEKETTKLEEQELSEFELKVQELGIGDEYNLETIIHNPNNQYEAIGLLHNYGCDLLTEKFKEFDLQKGFDKNAFCKNGYELAKSMNMEISVGALENIPFERILSKSDFVGDENLNQLVQEGLLTENLKKSFIRLRETAMQCSVLDELQNRVIQLENEFLADESLSELEKENILSACAIARYSSAYWISEGVVDTSSKTVWWMIFLCDAAGGVIGGTTTGGVGAVVGAALASGLAGAV